MSFSVPFPRRQQKQRKVLLMGKSGAGKSSMRSIVFSNYVARDVRRLGATIDIEHSHIKFMGNLMLNLWDCGGQDGFFDNFINRKRPQVFEAVTVLIFVFDVNSFDQNVDLANYQSVLQALGEHSPTAKIFILIHKMDLVPLNKRDSRLASLVQTIRDATFSPFEGSLFFFGTSIWDQTLYKAWTAIIYSLIPNVVEIETKLKALAKAINARELILYERTTCLMVTHISQGLETKNPFLDRFERISSILKTHNLSLLRYQTGSVPDPMSLSGVTPSMSAGAGAGPPAGGPGPGTGNANLGELHIKTGQFSFFITRLTENTNLAAAIPPSEQAFNIARTSILEAQPRFAVLDFGGPTGSSAASASAGAGATAISTSTATTAAAAAATTTTPSASSSTANASAQSHSKPTSSHSGAGFGMAAAAATLAANSGMSSQSGRPPAHHYHSHRSGTQSRSRRQGHDRRTRPSEP